MPIRALLIDDDQRLAELLAVYLAPHEVLLQHAPDGPRGLAAVAAGGVDVVVLDVMMPAMDGLEVLRRLRATSAVPVIMLTARGDETDRVVGLELGADDYLPKPAWPRELLARIRAVLRRVGPRATERRLRIGDLEIDPESRRARVGEADLGLTALEFDLLLALILGVAGGWLAQAGEGPSLLLLVPLGLVASWMLAWVATRRISRPVHQLARIAAELHAGRLSSRTELPEESAELGDLSRSLRGMAERLKRQLEDQKALMAAVSHELRSPLGRARVLVELAREGHGEPNPYDALQGKIDAMDGLVADLLAAARIDFDAVAPRALDAVDAARRALEPAQLPAERLVVSGAPTPIQADASLLGRALAVLLANGQGHGGGVSALHVDFREEGTRFAVEDEGPGFGPGEAEHAFAPFWRGDGVRSPGEGLGLALVRRIAEIHGGRAGAENRAEGGARCWVER